MWVRVPLEVRKSQWPNGQGVGFRSRRLGVRVPSGMRQGCARSVMVIIGASQALDPGSIPGRRNCELFHTGALAQSEECVLCKHEVRGSKPRCSSCSFAPGASFCASQRARGGPTTALVAQLVEHGSNKPRVGGSSPSWSMTRSYSVMVITKDFESFDPGSSPGRT